MARLFDDASTQYLQHAAAVVSGAPLTMACWFNVNDATINNGLMGIGRQAVDSHYFFMGANGAIGGDPVQVQARGTTVAAAVTTAGFSANTWNHAAGVFSAADSRAVYLNGGNKGTNTTSQTPESLDRTTIGALNNGGSIIVRCSGLIAEAGIWSAALTDAEVASLADGVSPLLVRPESLVAYWPLIGRTSPEIDVVGGFGMTVTGAVAAEHPRIYLPSPGLWIPPAAEVGGASIPILAYHYNHHLGSMG